MYVEYAFGVNILSLGDLENLLLGVIRCCYPVQSSWCW
jgi:hypothetical protein